MSKITYQIKIDNQHMVWIDRLVAGVRVYTHGPYWSLWDAGKQIRKWEAEEASI